MKLLRKTVFFIHIDFAHDNFIGVFRGDLITGVIVLILSASSFWLVAIIWAFLYNRVYTTRLLERGYVFDDDPEKVREAKRALRIQE